VISNLKSWLQGTHRGRGAAKSQEGAPELRVQGRARARVVI
jgi:hypothetical protein